MNQNNSSSGNVIRDTDQDEVINCMTCHILDYIKRLPGTCDSKLEHYPPCVAEHFESWHRNNVPLKLPKDIGQFYSMTNGLKLKWHGNFKVLNEDNNEILNDNRSSQQSIKFKISHDGKNREVESKKILIGYSSIFSIEKVISLSSKKINTLEQQLISSGLGVATCVKAAFTIEYDPQYGVVAMVYGPDLLFENEPMCMNEDIHHEKLNESTSIWFCDLKGTWYPLASTFTNYFRMIIVHLGIKGWSVPSVILFFIYSIIHFLIKYVNNLQSLHYLSIKINFRQQLFAKKIDQNVTLFARKFIPERFIVDLAYAKTKMF